LRHYNSIITRCTSHLSAITRPGLYVAYNRTFGDLSDGQDVANSQRGLKAGIYELAGVKTLGGSHKDVVLLVSVDILELNLGDGSTTALD
jgi:hypothetical protein